MIRCDRCGAEPADHRDIRIDIEEDRTDRVDLCDACCAQFPALIKAWCQPLSRYAIRP